MFAVLLLDGLAGAVARLLVSLSVCLVPPVSAPIVEPFVAPLCPYCAGHRGIEYEVEPATVVLAAAAGEAEFSGVVAGVRYLVIRHRDGVRATYGMLQSSSVVVGDLVAAGQPIARSGTRVYFGLRDLDDTPIDPTGLLATVTRRPRLVPIDGSAGRDAEQRRPSCAGRAGTAVPAR